MHDAREGFGEFATLTTWPPDIPTLLPKADAVDVWHGKTEMLREPWDDAADADPAVGVRDAVADHRRGRIGHVRDAGVRERQR